MTMPANHNQRDLVPMIYAAAFDAALWPDVFTTLSADCGDASGLLHVYDASTRTTPVMVPFGIEPGFMRSFESHFQHVNPYPDKNVASRFAVGMVGDAREVVAPDVLESGEFYNDWMKPQGFGAQHYGIVLSRAPQGMGVLTVAPSQAYAREHHTELTAHLEGVAPHFVRSIRFAQQMQGIDPAAEALGSGFDLMGFAAFVLRPGGKIVHANALAQTMLAKRDTVQQSIEGVLEARDAGLQQSISAGLAAALQDSQAIGPPVRLPAKADNAVRWAWFIACRERTHLRAEHWITQLNGLGAQKTVLMLVTQAAGQRQVDPGAVRGALALTSAEAALTAALVSGASLADYAAHVGLSRNTLKNQLASVFDKTGTCRQAELVAHVLSALGPFANAGPKA